ncbi:MAG: DNA/RNA helicase domain-containing protein, partial [Verrucomicrobiota bacterium]
MAAFYRAALADFLTQSPDEILGALLRSYQHNELQKRQTKAWEIEIKVLKSACENIILHKAAAAKWSLLLEYPIPRRKKRLDGVLLAEDVIICLEFKTEDKIHSLQPQRQVEDYALDLRDFHEVSRHRRIVPVVIVPKAPQADNSTEQIFDDVVRHVRLANAADLASVLLMAFEVEHAIESEPIDPTAWDNSPYRPVPTIIEAAEALFAGHNVREIAHSHAGATNLTTTSDRLVEIIQRAQQTSEKVICFVTGVPGAGKTLAGLNVVHNPALRREGRPAGVFLSGNGPLVKIVSAAIARDHKRRVRETGGERTVGTFIQNVHVFVREGLEKADKPPVEKVVVFDEAQRAWNANQNRKKNGLEISEPETMLSIMDRHQDWAVLVALVGGGQEIHNGEAGLAEWGKTLREKFPKWKVVVSPKALENDASTAGHRLFPDTNAGSLVIQTEPSLHLEVNLRSFRAQKLAEWVDAALAGDTSKAAATVPKLRNFPFALTRSLATARAWLRENARGQQRVGLVASSGALRLRADGLELSSGFRQGNRDMYVHWFLAHPPDVRSSNQLEVAASEFECQGLELDWIGLCWGGDFSFDATGDGWAYRNFSGTRWGILKNEIDRQYLL